MQPCVLVQERATVSPDGGGFFYSVSRNSPQPLLTLLSRRTSLFVRLFKSVISSLTGSPSIIVIVEAEEAFATRQPSSNPSRRKDSRFNLRRREARTFPMIRKRYQEAKTGLQLVKSMNAQKYLKKIGLGKEDHYFWKQVGKALLCTYTLFGVAWLYNETSPLGWWTLKPKPKEERELAHLYERRQFPYPGDEVAMEEFVAKGGMIGTTIGPKGIVESDKDSYNFQKELQSKKYDQEAQKLWIRMRNEVISELQEKGYDVE